VHEPGRVVVVFSGGGTGGHLYPALALADALVRLRPDVHPFFVGASRGLEARVLPERGVDHLLLPVEGFARGSGLAGARALPGLGRSLLLVADLARTLRPEVVVVTGGYAGGPAGIVAGLLGIPLVLQEQNALPGVTTRLLSRWARQIHLAFPEAAGRLPERVRGRVQESGNPVRPLPAIPRARAREAFGLPDEGLVVLVSGGSQGAIGLNRALTEAVRGVVQGDLERPEGLILLWSTGPRHFEGIAGELARLGEPAWVRALPYIEDVPSALAAADVAIGRAGAMTTAEFLEAGLPAILVPLPTAAANHQALNAEALEKAGAAVVAPEAGLTGDALWAHVARLARDGALRARMGEAARGRARPGGAAKIAAAVAVLLPEARA